MGSRLEKGHPDKGLATISSGRRGPAPDPAKLAGGCQCGRVRYRLSMAPEGVHYCHCRMCQRAVGNIFAALAPVRKTAIAWQGEPGFFRSSSAATRGYCRDCGTPLTFAYDKSEWICVTVGSLDHPAAVRPEIHYGVESQVPWFHLEDGLKRETTEEASQYLAGMVNHQAQF